METLSSSVSSIKISTLQHQLSHPHYFKAPLTHPHHQNLHFSSSSSSSTLIKKHPNPAPNSFPASTTTTFSHTQFIKTHSLAATGYATALIDVSKLTNSLGLVNKGVKKLRKWLNNEDIGAILSDPFGEEREKGEILMELVEKGRLNKQLVTLMRVLVKKGRVGIVSEVLNEFERIYDELCGTSPAYFVAF